MSHGPGYARAPEHVITVTPFDGRVKIIVKGEVLVDTTAALRLAEASYPAVYYVPRSDVKMDRLERTTHSTHCPFKGDASYFTIKDHADNAVWTYETPYDEVEIIREHLAFYPSKVDAIEITPA